MDYGELSPRHGSTGGQDDRLVRRQRQVTIDPAGAAGRRGAQHIVRTVEHQRGLAVGERQHDQCALVVSGAGVGPEPVDPEQREVVEAVGDSRQVTYAVSVRVRPGCAGRSCTARRRATTSPGSRPLIARNPVANDRPARQRRLDGSAPTGG